MFININGVELYYEKRGPEEARPLILVHGNGEDHSIFEQSLLLLEKRFCCYAVDSRCHGQSGEGPLHYSDMAADMLAFLEVLELRDVIFYGFSDGGIVGLLAASQTDRITTLITSGANLNPNGVKLPLRLLVGAMNFLKPDPKLALMLREPWISDDVLGRITAHTIVLAGSKDVIPEKETRHIAETVPDAELYILKGESHGSYIIHSEKIAKLIIENCRIR